MIIEVGANIGQTTIELAKEIPEATIYCFEPEPRVIEQFKKNVNTPNVHLIEAAVGNENGKISFHQSSGIDEYKDWHQSGSIKKPKEHLKFWPKVSFPTLIEVPIVRLDDWIDSLDIPMVDFIWADTQGAEADLILGAENTLRKTRFIYTEYGPYELYDGQISLEQIDKLLVDFSITRLFDIDALFENMHYKKIFPESDVPRVSRIETCPCGSGKRYKNCHGMIS